MRNNTEQYEDFLRSGRSTQHPDGASGSQSRTPSMVMESPTSRVPTQISIEDFVSQPGRDRLPKLHPDRIDGATWFESSHNGITKSILGMMHGLLTKPYEKFSNMPSDEQEMWFKQFAQEFNWHRDLTPEVRRKFKQAAAKHYSKTLNEWKQRWNLGKKPKGINDDVYKGLQEYWAKPDTQKDSKIHSENRKSQRGGKGMAVQNAGATSYYSRAEQLTQRDGVPPDYLVLMEDTHTNKKTGEIQDPVIKEVIENAKKKKEDYILTQQSQPSIDGSELPTTVPTQIVNQIVLEETPKRKGRIFGLGNLGIFGSSSCYSSPYVRDAELQKALEEKDERIAALEKMMAEEKAANQRRDEEAKLREEAAKLREEKMQKFMDDMLARFPGSSS